VPGDHCKAGTKRSVYPVTDRIMELDIEVETSLPAHYERNLGPIAQGWSDKKSVHGIQIISFVSQPEAGVTTFATLGLSRFGKNFLYLQMTAFHISKWRVSYSVSPKAC
jgi:hypothetical protein